MLRGQLHVSTRISFVFHSLSAAHYACSFHNLSQHRELFIPELSAEAQLLASDGLQGVVTHIQVRARPSPSTGARRSCWLSQSLAVSKPLLAGGNSSTGHCRERRSPSLRPFVRLPLPLSGCALVQILPQHVGKYSVPARADGYWQAFILEAGKTTSIQASRRRPLSCPPRPAGSELPCHLGTHPRRGLLSLAKRRNRECRYE
jgi:hypothetical protein